MAAGANISLTLNPKAAFAAFDEYARLQQIRGKTAEQTLKKVMRFWISFAMNKIDKADSKEIEANLMRLTARSSKLMVRSRKSMRAKTQNRFGRVADKYRGTLAAAIVAILGWGGVKNASSMKGRKRVVGDGALFYQMVPKFISARKYAAGVHRAGFNPAVTALRITGTGKTPKYKRVPGTYTEDIKETAATLVAENFASAASFPGRPAKGITGIAPTVLKDAEADMAKELARWLEMDLRAAAERAGFYTAARAA